MTRTTGSCAGRCTSSRSGPPDGALMTEGRKNLFVAQFIGSPAMKHHVRTIETPVPAPSFRFSRATSPVRRTPKTIAAASPATELMAPEATHETD